MLDVVFINPPADGNFLRELNRCSKRSMIGEVWPQTALAYLSSFLEHKGFSAEIVDCIAECCGPKYLVKILNMLSPRFVVLLVSTTTFYNDAKIARLIKNNVGCKVCAVGHHVSALPLEALCYGFDFVIRGEAELALLELLRGTHPENIPGLCFFKDKKFIDNGFGLLVKDLDTLGAPDRIHLPNSKYHIPLFKGAFATVITSRGCPFDCTFCRTKSFYGNSFRQRTPLNVASEIMELYNQGIQNFFFQADTFTADKKWVLRLCSILRRERLDVTWATNSRVDCFGKDIAHAMASAGCKLVTFGVESGSQRILDSINKRITLAQSLHAVRNASFAGILSAAHFIIGVPEDDGSTISETIRFSLKLMPDFATFNYATPYPGTILRAIMEREGCILTNDWSCYDNFHSNVVRTKRLDAGSLTNFIRKAMLIFYLNPQYIVRFARNLGYEDMPARIATGFIRQQMFNVLAR